MACKENFFFAKLPYFCHPLQKQSGAKGTLAEWLGRGLQNLVQQFESAGYLFPKLSMDGFFFFKAYCFTMALSKEEQEFIHYWQANRLGKKKFLRQFSIAFPLTVLMVLALFINIFSGWDKRAEMIIRGDASSLYVVIIAIIGIAVFVTVFSSRHKWEQNEQRFLELKEKEKRPDAAEG